MDGQSSAAPLKISSERQVTLTAATLCRLLARRLEHRPEHWWARQIFERFLRTWDGSRLGAEAVEVRAGPLAHNPQGIAAGFRKKEPVIQWLGNRLPSPAINGDKPKSSARELPL